MSVFGGDSWGREAQYRKRRVDDLLLDTADHSSYRKLPTGKYACLVCPHNPVLDTPLMLSMHMKASRHCAAERKLKQREEERQNDMNKRIALSLESTSMTRTGNTSTKQTNLAAKPLIERTRKATLEVLNGYPERGAANNSQSRWPIPERSSDLTNSTSVQMEGSGKDVVQLLSDHRERRERELRFTSAGWKRDCHGGWFRDENFHAG
ncbi:sodium channel modifier 1-like isoform X2 [Cynara cardunculus var. scolymus]|uniref:sodium channel modifier 1-like isoform X2 n=1 Tax=Cynara cardunculus var. scolymus TaxID=59895 RepID=UPI000D630E3B|nr:sodium channel modifier 1-like isoform X2 [Cynara cardunculus var. scolymus]